MDRLEHIARRRITRNLYEIKESLRHAEVGNPLGAENDPVRMRGRLMAKSTVPSKQSEAMAEYIDLAARAEETGQGLAAEALDLREKVWGDTMDFVSVSFLTKGAEVARSVGRVAFENGSPLGSGVLVGPGLFLTNHHVIEHPSQTAGLVLEFDYETDLSGRPRPISRFHIDPSVFITDDIEGLDFTLIAVGALRDGETPLSAFGTSSLSDAGDKHMLGEFANIVQHPQGRFKEVVLRENRLVSRLADCLHYVADTEPGSSGSPVYNSEWQMIALHHWGGPWKQWRDDQGRILPREINEGIRISSIVRFLREELADLEASTRRRVALALALESDSRGNLNGRPSAGAQGPSHSPSEPRLDSEGRVTWTLPLEVSVRLPGLAAPTPATQDAAPPEEPQSAEERRPRRDYSDRSGYDPDFLPGHHIALPELGETLEEQAAPNRLAKPDDHPFELKYHHFSVVVNRVRRLAFFTACNTDGATAKGVNRKKKQVRPLTLGVIGPEALVDELIDAEGESWFKDPRLDEDHYAAGDVYSGQVVPGFPDPRSRGRILRMFQRGHLVRRLDPTWGDDTDHVLAAERDTFHWTNCSPQVGAFNQGRSDRSIPGSGDLWRAVENHMLRAALVEKKRATSFTGPIFRDDDPFYRSTFMIPRRFFKIVVWIDRDALKSLALIADQEEVLTVMPEAFQRQASEAMAGRESFTNLTKVRDFLSTIEEIENATGLSFGDEVRAGDIRRGEATAEVEDEESIRSLLTHQKEAAPASAPKAKRGKRS